MIRLSTNRDVTVLQMLLLGLIVLESFPLGLIQQNYHVIVASPTAAFDSACDLSYDLKITALETSVILYNSIPSSTPVPHYCPLVF